MRAVTLVFVMALVLRQYGQIVAGAEFTVCLEHGRPAGLPHMNDGATSFKANFIHQVFHQVDSTAMAGLDIFRSGWIWDVARVEPLPLIPDDDRNFVSPAAAANVHMLPRVLMVAMNDGIREGLA